MDEMELAVASLGKDGTTDLMGVVESFVNYDKEVKPWGVGHVDDTSLISRDLVREVMSKCTPFSVELNKDGQQSRWGPTAHGQGGFIRRETLQNSPGGSNALTYSVYPVTAKHNLRHVGPDARRDSQPDASFSPSNPALHMPAIKIRPQWGDLGWTPDAATVTEYDLRVGTESRPSYSEYGFDMSVSDLIQDGSSPACIARHSFSKVSRSKPVAAAPAANDDTRYFSPEVGQKVGIAVRFSDESKPTHKTIVGLNDPDELENVDIEKYYGKPGQVNIYTGEITYVGPKHIEYTINSFTGCSGAVVFLLDQDQPDSVHRSQFGRAIAVHTGAHPSLRNRNYGFLINAHPAFNEYD